jgi:hypothetical protein
VFIPVAESPAILVIEEPQLHPAYTTCKDSHWYQFQNNRGHYAYLTLNVSDDSNSTNHGEWHPVIPQSGYYRVEAYIATHNPVYWCSSGNLKEHDTSDAHYSIHYAYGVINRSLSQYPLSNQWLNLGEFYFNKGTGGYVSLTDLNNETDFSTTVSYSAMRFTFIRPEPPKVVYMPVVSYSEASIQAPQYAGAIQAQGFDACHLPEISEMKTWWDKSPYRFYALYLGGISLFHECSIANSAWVSAVHLQGWSFLPTWVGPQAPCSGYKNKMSSDPALSYLEGRREAEAASAKAASIGLTGNGSSGTVIYYDMEVYGGASLECRQATASFMNGWVQRLHELGNFAGGYGGRNSYASDWATIANVPNDIWAASWYTNTYDPSASVFGLTWLNGLWTNHQRIRQYTGGHDETWGGIKFNIDSDVADGVVALPPTKPLVDPIVTKSLSIEDTGWISVDRGWLVSGSKLYWTDDQGKNWKDLSPEPIQIAYFLPSGQAWALSAENNDGLNLYHSTTNGEIWEMITFPLPPDGSWRPIQIQFNSATSGWVVLQKQTSQAFDVGLLMKTNDGGLTWQSYDLPSASPIQFSSPTEGWMTNRSGDELYHTVDSGITWQHVESDQNILSQKALPDSATLSGSQVNDLNWVVTSVNDCSGEKSYPGFTCWIDTNLQQSLDGGKTWQVIPLPKIDQIKP